MKKIIFLFILVITIKASGQRVTGSNSVLLKSEVTATQVGLGNVTNESKATMFSSPTFTGTVTYPSSQSFTTPSFTTGFTIGGAAASGKFIVGNGTNFVASTSTIPTSAGATALKWLRSDGTNYILSTSTLAEGGVTSGKLLISDGTNWIASTPTHTTSATLNKIIYGDGTNWVLSTPTVPLNASPGAGKILAGDGTNFVLSTPTFPYSASATSRKMIVSDGTNWVASTETWPVPSATAGTHMVGDGTNWTAVNERTNWTSFVVSGSDATTTGQTLVDITGLTSGTLTNSTKYEVEAWLDVSTSAVTTGTQYAIFANGTGGAAVYNALVQGTTTTNAITQVTQSSATQQGTFLTTSGTSGIIYLHGFITTRGTGTATISIQHLKVTSGTSTVKVGSKMLIRLAN